MNRLNKILLFVFALALLVPALPAAAQSRGGHGGGGRGGGGGGHFGGGHFGGGGRGGRVFIGVGGGWGWGYWGWPGWYGYYGPGYGYYDEGRVYGPSSRYAVIDTDISPEEAEVYLDGRYIGTADDFDGYPDYLYLQPGRYRIEFRLDGYQTLTRQIEARPGVYLDFTDKLRKIPGAKHRGSYEHPRLQGGEVRRYFGRSRDSVEAIDPTEPPAGASVMVEPDDDDRDAPPPAPALRQPRRDRDQYGDRWRAGQGSRAESRTRLRLNVEPSDAAVYVDNRFVGTAEEVNSLERGVSISAGKHTVTVSRPGFRDKTTDITVEPGRTETLEISLGR
jgi:hypothetical protein